MDPYNLSLSEYEEKWYYGDIPSLEEIMKYEFRSVITNLPSFLPYETTLKSPDLYTVPKYGLDKPIFFISELADLMLKSKQKILFKGKPRYIIDVIMTELNPEALSIILSSMKMSSPSNRIDVLYNFFWYLNFSSQFLNKKLYKNSEMVKDFDKMLYYISSLNKEELLEILGDKYKDSDNPKDEASLLFSIFSLCSTYVDPEDIPRYKKVKYYPPDVVWFLAYHVYGIIDEEKSKASVYPPYVFVALNDPSDNFLLLEEIILSINPLNVEPLAERYKIGLPDVPIKERINHLRMELVKRLLHLEYSDPVIIFSEPITAPKEKRIIVKNQAPYVKKVSERFEQRLSEADFEPYTPVTEIKYNNKMIELKDFENQDIINYIYSYQKLNIEGQPRYIFDLIMTEATPCYIRGLLTSNHFYYLYDTIDVYYNLFWYLNMSKEKLLKPFTESDFIYISSASDDEILKLLGPKYKDKPKDRASLIFAALTGKSTHIDPNDIPRYNIVKYYPPNFVWFLAYYAYKIIDEEKSKVSVYPPHVIVALKNPPDLIESLIVSLNPLNLDLEIKDKISIPSYITDINKRINYSCIELIKNKKSVEDKLLKEMK
ncbi:MAG: hypothetical protein QW303_09015 [Nitrososphaerota archaeon]